MKSVPLFFAAGMLCLAATVQARTPIFIEYEGVKGETTKAQPAPAPQPRPGKNSRPVIRIDHHDPAARQGGVRVATGDVTGDGRANAALLLPAVQKVRVAPTGGNQPTATSTQGPYKVNGAATGQTAPVKPKPSGSMPNESITLNYPKP